MTIAGLVTALLVGVAVGVLGRFIVPGRQEAPIWLTVAVGVVAALAGTIAAQLTGIGTDGLNVLALIVPIGLAGIGVALVAATATHERPRSAGNRNGAAPSTRRAAAATRRTSTTTMAA